MQCAKCGKEMPPEKNFCTGCGARLAPLSNHAPTRDGKPWSAPMQPQSQPAPAAQLRDSEPVVAIGMNATAAAPAPRKNAFSRSDMRALSGNVQGKLNRFGTSPVMDKPGTGTVGVAMESTARIPGSPDGKIITGEARSPSVAKEVSVDKGVQPKVAGKETDGDPLDTKHEMLIIAKGRALGNPREALQPIDDILKTDPTNRKAWYFKGRCLSEFSLEGEAVKCFDKANELEPSFVPAWLDKASSLIKLGNRPAALKCYEVVLSFQPHNDGAWYGKADTEHKLGRKKDAIYSFKQFMSIADPKSVANKMEIARKRLAELSGEGKAPQT